MPVTGLLKIVGMAFQNPTLLPWRNTLLNTMLPLEIVQPHLQLPPPARVVESFVAQNPDRARPNCRAQISLKSGSSRTTK
jgi:ABC-type nitrate/sulfonate/bicarbonate transport system ATPase subunit